MSAKAPRWHGQTAPLVVYLKDGRTVDMSDCPPADMLARLHAHSATLADIEDTVHLVKLPPRTA